ncbi:MAG: methylmalonyl Co-A mutase-associated GTPase MeaB [Acidobacteria bacterium]|nr:methylmalonyl Co-A mutase-associated GTPase MeaB [Acidobacteriota bacterium]
MNDLAQRVLSRDERALARAISVVENEEKNARSLMGQIYSHTGNARILGITGPPGAGKSTLTDGLVAGFADLGKQVGVIAVDPTSPFSGGAVLGDRIRMRKISTLPGVFVRSMATRGAMGGLTHACMDTVDIMDAAGMDIILIETVGVGQDEIEIIRVSELNLVVLVPGSGDEIQAIKAGIMEIADIFVINKADRDGVEKLESQLQYLNQLSSKNIPIIRTVAISNQGVDELGEAVLSVLGSQRERESVDNREAERADYRLRNVLSARFLSVAKETLGESVYEKLVYEVASRKIDPYTASDRIIALLKGSSHGSRAH